MSRRAVRPGFAIAAVLFLLALPAGAVPPDNKPQGNIRVTFVNIGAGLCTVIECPGDPALTAPILYDCGSSGPGDTGLNHNGAVLFVQTILNRYGVRAVDVEEAAKQADVLVVAVKPQDIDPVLVELAPLLGVDSLVVSLCAGLPTALYERHLASGVPVVRVMLMPITTSPAGLTATAG